jgi:hypothetical protein
VSGGGTPASPDAVATWFPCFAFDYTLFTGFAALVGDVQIYSLLSKGTIEDALIKTSIPFAGGGIASLKLSVGIVGNLAKIISPYDAMAAVTDTNFLGANIFEIESFAAAGISIRLAAQAVGADLTQLTAGAGCLWLKGARLP